MIVSPIGWMAPAPSPCRPRATISAGMDQAMPQSTDDTRNTVTPKTITGLRPTTSASLP